MSATLASPLPGHATALPPAERARRERRFFSLMSLSAAVAVVWGFGPTYFLKQAYDTPPLSPLLHVHAAVFSAWIVLLLAQTALVATRNTPLHRRLGQTGAVIIPAMLVLGWMAGVDAARRGSTIPGLTPQAFLIIPLAAIVVFTGLATCAMLLKRRPDYHKRLMLLATIELLTAAVARISFVAPYGPAGFFGVTDLFVLAIFAFDYITLRKVHPATLWGGLILIASQPLRLLITATPFWSSFAAWLTN